MTVLGLSDPHRLVSWCGGALHPAAATAWLAARRRCGSRGASAGGCATPRDGSMARLPGTPAGPVCYHNEVFEMFELPSMEESFGFVLLC